MTAPSSSLATALRACLQRVAARSEKITYQALAIEMQLQPPNTIHQLTTLLEELMREDAATHQPFIAALVVSKRPPYLPGRGFFQCATELGRFGGIDSEASIFHARELAQAQAFWSATKQR